MINLWGRMSLTQRFGLASGLVMLVGMATIGAWVASQIEEGTIENAAAASALVVDSFVSPLGQELADSDTLSIGPVRALEETLRQPHMAEKIISVKVWKPDGTIAYSDDISLIGEKFPIEGALAAALKGEISSEFNSIHADESANLIGSGVPLLEVYSPLYAQWNNEVIAVVEFYEDATQLADTLNLAQQRSWLVVGAVTVGMALALLGIVHSGSVQIQRQQVSLRRAFDENRQLLSRIEKASGRAVELTEQQLRRVSADLHDGPAQMVSLAALRIGTLRIPDDKPEERAEVDAILTGLQEAVQDIRNICKGLSLPQIEDQSLAEIVGAVADGHVARVGQAVEMDVRAADVVLPVPVKICVFRFLQEGLNNAFRHGDGGAAEVRLEADAETLDICVCNMVGALGSTGERLAAQREDGTGSTGLDGLGLAGLKERVETLGGQFTFVVTPTGRAELKMKLSLAEHSEA